MGHNVKDATSQMLIDNNPFVPPTTGCPVNDLPNELLSLIFILGTAAQEGGDEDEDEDEEVMSDDDSDDSQWGGGRSVEFQVLVSHVCQHWRNVALETPALWTTLDFSDGPPFDKARLWIERSKKSPLTIDIDATKREADEPDPEDYESDEDISISPPELTTDDLKMLLDLLVPHVDRWRVFQVMVSEYERMFVILQRLALCPAAPLLEVFQLYHYEDSDEIDWSTFHPPAFKQAVVPFHGDAPRLTHVGLWGVHINWSQSTFLSNLDDLELSYHAHDVRPTFAEFEHILRASPALQTLTLSLSGPSGGDKDWPKDVIELPTVRELIIAFHEPEYIGPLMQRLSLPALRDLTLDFDTGDFGPLIKQLASPIPNAGASDGKRSLLSTIENLKIGGLPCSHHAIDELYAALPNLLGINLNLNHLEDAFVHKLVRPRDTQLSHSGSHDPSPQMFLPNLTTFIVSGLTGEQIRELVEIRARSGCPLKSVLINEEDAVDEVDVEWLRDNLVSFDFFEGSDDTDGESYIDEDEDEDQDDNNDVP